MKTLRQILESGNKSLQLNHVEFWVICLRMALACHELRMKGSTVPEDMNMKT